MLVTAAALETERLLSASAAMVELETDVLAETRNARTTTWLGPAVTIFISSTGWQNLPTWLLVPELRRCRSRVPNVMPMPWWPPPAA
jgi:hypothetical protein